MNQASCKKATEDIQKSLGAKVAKGELNAEQVKAALSHIKTSTELSEAKSADAVIETVFEKEGFKRKALAELDDICAPNTLSPLESADFMDLDNCIALLQNPYQDYGDPRYFPSPLLAQMVNAGQLGRKTGRVFLNYA